MFVKGKNKAWAALFVPPPILPGPEAILITDCECTRFLATGTLGPNEEKGNGNQRSD